MGVVLARCKKCDRSWRVTVYQERGKRLRNQRSVCCAAGFRRQYRTQARAGSQARP